MDVWQGFERMRDLIMQCEGKTKSAGLNAIDHILKARKLIDIDPQMACFRAICAEEEAATSLLSSIKDQSYQLSGEINIHSHPNKAGVIIFVSAVIDWFHKSFILNGDHFGSPIMRFTDEPGRTAIEILLPLLGTDKCVHPRPPLDLRTQGGSTLQDMIGESVRIKLKHNLASEIKGAISTRANQRNLLLYASDNALAGQMPRITEYLENQAAIVNALLTAVGLIDPWRSPKYSHAGVVESAVLEFVSIMKSVNRKNTVKNPSDAS